MVMVLVGKVFMRYLQMPAISTYVVITRVQTVTPISYKILLTISVFLLLKLLGQGPIQEGYYWFFCQVLDCYQWVCSGMFISFRFILLIIPTLFFLYNIISWKYMHVCKFCTIVIFIFYNIIGYTVLVKFLKENLK